MYSSKIKEEMYSSKIKEEMYSFSSQGNKTQPKNPPTHKDYSRYFLISLLLSMLVFHTYKKNLPGKKFQEESPDFKLFIEKFISNFGIQQKPQIKRRLIQTKNISPVSYFSLHAY